MSTHERDATTRTSVAPAALTRRAAVGRLLSLAGAGLALAALPAVAHAAPAPDPLDAAAADLWAGFEAANRAYEAGDEREAIMLILRRPIALLKRLTADHGPDAGVAIWRAAMAEHTRIIGCRTFRLGPERP